MGPEFENLKCVSLMVFLSNNVFFPNDPSQRGITASVNLFWGNLALKSQKDLAI